MSGASANESQAALLQFGQALSAGVLRGEELNSVLEQAPALAKTLADGMGITVGQLRTLGQEGKLTAENVIQALQSQAGAVNQQFATIETTGGQALTVLSNSLIKVVGDLDVATGSSTAFAGVIQDLSDWLDTGELTDGLLTSLGSLTYPIIKERVEQVVTVSETGIVESMKFVWERAKIVIEPSAATVIAVLWEKKIDLSGLKVGVILSGGNVDLEKLPWQK